MTPTEGALFWYFLAAVILTVPASFVIVAWYRRAIRRSMTSLSGAATEAPTRALGSLPRPQALPGAPPTEGDLRQRLLVIYAVGGLVGGAILVWFWRQSTALELTVSRAILLGWINGAPVAGVMATLLALPRRWAWRIPALYVLTGAAVMLTWSLISLHLLGRGYVKPGGNLMGYGKLLVLQALPPLLIVALTGNRKLRPVSPLVLAALLLFGLGSMYAHASVKLFLDNDLLSRRLPAYVTFSWLWPMLASLPVGYLCWRVLRWLGRLFQRKAFSDIQLVVDSWMLIAFLVMTAWTPGPLGSLVGLGSFVAYRIVVAAGLALWPLRTGQTPRRLLMLRVFGFQQRTEALYDQVLQRWRLLGSVNMIGGVDLAGRTLDPGEIITFLGGDVSSLFVRTGVDLQSKLSALDEGRDPDGRFRNNEVYCHADTWRPTLESLLARSDAVLMDLRGFTEANQGCLFELQKIVESGRLEQTLFVVDHSTDLRLLRVSLGSQDVPTPHLARIETGSGREMAALFTSLRQLAVPDAA